MARKRQPIDISLGGVRIFSDDRLKIGELLKLEFFLDGAEPLTYTAQVVWIEPLPESAPARFDVGLKFLQLEPDALGKCSWGCSARSKRKALKAKAPRTPFCKRARERTSAHERTPRRERRPVVYLDKRRERQERQRRLRRSSHMAKVSVRATLVKLIAHDALYDHLYDLSGLVCFTVGMASFGAGRFRCSC